MLCFCLQMRRLRECERMLVALELAGWLNEANLALQAVVQCYGLLAPLIFYKIPSVAVVQVLNLIHSFHWSNYRSKGHMQRSFKKKCIHFDCKGSSQLLILLLKDKGRYSASLLMILTFNLSQVLQRCHVVLQEIPAGLRQKRQQSIADSLHHMTACITYSMAKVRPVLQDRK